LEPGAGCGPDRAHRRRAYGFVPEDAQMKGRALATLLLLAVAALGQRSRFLREDTERPPFPASGEFHFIRLEYTDLPQYHRRFGYSSRSGTGEGWWMVDWPDAEDHFTMGVQRLTRIDCGEPRHLRLTD